MKQNDIILELKNVTRTFSQGGAKIEALKKTNFVAKSGQLIAIIGPSGSGKSTFLTIAGGLQSPTHGKVSIDSVDITNLSSKQLSSIRLSKVGFVLQASNLVPFLTLEKQLQLLDKVSRRKTNKAQMHDLFKKLGIQKLKDKYPSDLSGGERQRAVITKVLYGDSKLILADEPTASLDTKKAYEVVELLARETRGQNKATIMVTHDERLISYCDKVYEMHDGEISERTRHKQTKK